MNESKLIYFDKNEIPTEIPFYKKTWFITLSRLINLFVSKIPPLRKYVSNTIPFLNGKIPRIYREGKYIEAIELSLSGLLKCNKNMEENQFYWWSFLSYAVYCADCLKNAKILNVLVSISGKGTQPFTGYNAAYCFCRFSRLKYEQEQYDLAVNFAKLAKEADDESGEAYFLLGFYELFLNENDPIEYFKEAIKRDQKILSWIIHNPHIKEFPEIINELTELHKITKRTNPSIYKDRAKRLPGL
ncbi:MAG: hypothetical protein JXB49_00045 [Bacteroidales bacterium]|nr:hypothetical protein [Bacteroidales bacterium]